MRHSVWILSLLAIGGWLAAVGFPLIMTGRILFTQSPGAPLADASRLGSLLILSAGWGLVVALGAMVLGWAPGRVLGGAISRRSFSWLAILMMAPICLPAYVIFYAWWQSWPPGSFLHDWALEDVPQRTRLLKGVTVYLGLVCWSWPIVAWCIAGSVASTPAQRDEMLLLDGAGPMVRVRDRLRTHGPGLALGGLVVFLLTFNNTTCFDLAEIFTYGNELRAVDALGATPRDTLAAGLGAAGLGLVGALVVWALMVRGFDRPPLRTRMASPAAWWVSLVIWIVAVAVPVGLMTIALFRGPVPTQLREFFSLYGGDLTSSIGLALVSGAAGGVIAAGMLVIWQSDRPSIRGIGHVIALGWVLAALVPGTLVGTALEAAYNQPLAAIPGTESGSGSVVSRGSESNTQLLAFVYQTPLIVILGHLARFGFVAALLSRWLAQREAPGLRDQRRLDGDSTISGLFRAGGPRLLGAMGGAAAIVFVLSLSEIAVTAQVHPATSRPPIALAILNAMHYQRPYTVMIASLALIGFALLAAMVVLSAGATMRRFARLTPALIGLGVCVLALNGCTTEGEPDTPLNAGLVFGAAGSAPGQFHYPRAIAVDDVREVLYVVDKGARVQRFDFEGTLLAHWRMPEWEMGKPTGINVAADGRIFVADTHYFRVLVYDDVGNELLRFGEYGQDPGQFIYTTDIEFGPGGELYVSEYGGNDRVQVFTPEGEYLRGFGGFGSETGQFNRPQSLVFNAEKTELYIADACNHRIVVVDPQGNVLRQFGAAGQMPGQLSYPYDVTLLPDETVLVCEFGNNRLQRFTPEGVSLGIYGRLGFDDGELQYPWGVDGTDEHTFVVDSGNNRVQRFRRPS